ncbi:cation/H(+) antiporter 4 [Cajanus cajan]|uniref:K(+)/H(+) antiporter 13 n=1 Tax=Cajanus cajan TaxID=3821 RepID=A0A151U1L8_CAJCA|nr:cation/H(+) antiporter 4 [Cajanus cajan]KYP73223.1 K(+)/H(+) antiporter 13 [Cajanus cajan]
MGTSYNPLISTINNTIFNAAVLDEYNSDPDRKFVLFNVSIEMPPKIVSDGMWGDPTYGALPHKSTMPLLQLQIITIFVITQCFHTILKHLGFPYFVSQVMTGFVLGPSLKIGALMPYKTMLFPDGSEDVLSLISGMGYTMFLFLTTVQTDFSMITRTGRKAWTIALSSLLIPTVVGLSLCYRFMGDFQKALGEFNGGKLPVVVINHSGCSFPVIVSLLSDLEILNSELGRLALSSSLVMDVISQVTTGLGTAIMSSLRTDSHDHELGKGPKLALYTILKYIGFLSIVIMLARPAMRKIVRITPEGRPVKKAYTYVVILMALAAGLLGLFANQPVLGGVLLLGLLVPEGPPLGSELIKQFELFNTWFLCPIFVTCCAMKVDILVHINGTLILIVATIIVFMHLLKMLITIIVCHYCHMPKTDGFCLALLLSSRGVVDFCTHVFLFDSMLMSNETMSMMAISVLVLGSIARIGVKALYDPSRKYVGYQKRNILNLKPNSELRMVACIHKPSHILSIRNALDIFCPTTSNPMVVHILHLMELVGRFSPIFISHRLQESVDSGYNYSEDVIVTFNLFEHDNAGTTSISTYTAISPLRFMHDDICYLALDKLACIILLPFHVRWNEGGSIESMDDNVRTLNSKVLERAPCSVGILVNRSSSSNACIKQIGLIFLGGPDDREALFLAKRAIKDCAYNLFVYHLASSQSESHWDMMLDDEVLKSVKGYYGSIKNVTYKKITIQDPSETADFVSKVANQHDFFIVGRRNGIKSPQTTTLENWTEFPELGVIGDLLASSDTKTNAFILVVQQQQMPKS